MNDYLGWEKVIWLCRRMGGLMTNKLQLDQP
jgi:hypothetical protein